MHLSSWPAAGMGLLAAALCCSGGADAQAPMRLEVQPLFFQEPEASGSSTVALVVSPADPNESISIENVSATEYKIASAAGGSLWRRILLDIKEGPPGYKSYPLVLKVPFLTDHLQLYVVAVNSRPGDRREVARLRDRDPNSLPGADLFRYYARARRQAEHYLDDPPGSSRDAVKAVYSYLQAARRLVRESYVIETGELERALAWLRDAIALSPNVVSGAVSLKHAQDLVDKVSEIEGWGYADLWQTILTFKRSDWQEYCGYVDLLQREITRLSDTKKEAIYPFQHLGAIITTAYTECLGRKFSSGRIEDQAAFREDLERQIRLLAEQQDILSETDLEWRTTIENRISELIEIRDGLPEETSAEAPTAMSNG